MTRTDIDLMIEVSFNTRDFDDAVSRAGDFWQSLLQRTDTYVEHATRPVYRHGTGTYDVGYYLVVVKGTPIQAHYAARRLAIDCGHSVRSEQIYA